MTLLLEYVKSFLESRLGQALASFLRVLTATVLACWVNAGMGLATQEEFLGWVQLGLQAAGGLVLANWFGPWEKRYGLGKSVPEDH